MAISTTPVSGSVVQTGPSARQALLDSFMTGPRQFADVTKLYLCTLMLNDSIHHRGQMSVYLRMSGAKVPSIYGPSADENPFM